MRQTKIRHPLSHTLEHLFSVSVILLIAITLGYIGKSVNIVDSTMLAQTYTTTGSSIPVTFSAVRMEIGCVNGVTTASYQFSISPELGGYIVLSTPTGPIYIDVNNGAGLQRYLQSGSYSWSGSSRPGYDGTNYGMINVENVCTTLNPPPPPPPPPTTTTETTITTTTTSLALESVSFAAQPAPTPNCQLAANPLTPVFLALTKPFGGNFLITSNSGMTNAPFEWGEHYFANGRYTWSARVNYGYVGEGPLSGVFEIAHTCPSTDTSVVTSVSATTNPPPPDSLTSTAQPSTSLPVSTVPSPISNPQTPLPPRPLVALFVENIPVAMGRVLNKEQVEMRVTTSVAESVEILLISGIEASRVYGKAVEDDLLSRPGIDVWTYVIDASALPEGRIKIQARVTHADLRKTLTDPMTITISHPTTTISGSGTQPMSTRVSEADRVKILARISDPSSCANADECRIYCRSLPGVNDLCIAHARVLVVANSARPLSLASELSDESLKKIIETDTVTRRSLPDVVTEPSDLKEYCMIDANFDNCANMLMKQDKTITLKALSATRDTMEAARNEERLVFTERSGTRAHYDTDQDGITDYDEINIYKSDPTLIDTDGDGFGDGAEVLARTNPDGGSDVVESVSSTGTSSEEVRKSDESVRQFNPKISGVTEPTLLAVKSVEVAELATNAQGSSTAKKLKMSGIALPNSFVTLYIFSEPIVVTVKADAMGAWVYTLDKELSDGTHQIYSAITDAGGRILAKSEPLPFVKVASAVSFGSGVADSVVEEPGFFAGPSLYAMMAMLIGILGVALSIIGFIVKQKRENEAGLPGI